MQILRLSEDVGTRVRLSALHRDKHRPVVKGEFNTFTVKYVLRGSASSEVIVIKRNRAGALEELPSSPKSEPDGQQMDCVLPGWIFTRALHEHLLPPYWKSDSSKTITDSIFDGTVVPSFVDSTVRNPRLAQRLLPDPCLRYTLGNMSSSTPRQAQLPIDFVIVGASACH